MLHSPPFVAPGAPGVDFFVLFRNRQISKLNGADASLPRLSRLKRASVRFRGAAARPYKAC